MGIFHRGFVVALLALGGLLVLARFVVAAAPSQDGAAVGFTLTTARGDAVEGERIYWSVIVEPRGRRVEIHGMEPADPQSWLVEAGQLTPSTAPTETAAIPLSAVPLKAGDLRPQLLIHYTLDDQRHTEVVGADAVVSVAPLTEPLQAEIVTARAATGKGDRWMVGVLLHNTSPFTLTGLSLDKWGADLDWGDVSVPDLPPGTTGTTSIPATVVGAHPLPAVTVGYSWQDDAARPHQGGLLVRGEVLPVAEPWPGWLEPFRPYASTAFGALLGLLVSLATLLVGELLRAWLRRRGDQAHVRGLLRLCVLQAREAARWSQPVPLQSIEAVYLGERGLYAVARRLRVYQQVAALYAAATSYNAGLADPGGAASRLETLKAQLDALDRALGKS